EATGGDQPHRARIVLDRRMDSVARQAMPGRQRGESAVAQSTEASFRRYPRRAVSIGVQGVDVTFAQSVRASESGADAAVAKLDDAAVEESNQQTAARRIHHEHGAEVFVPEPGPRKWCDLTLGAHSQKAEHLIGNPQIRLVVLDHRTDVP